MKRVLTQLQFPLEILADYNGETPVYSHSIAMRVLPQGPKYTQNEYSNDYIKPDMPINVYARFCLSTAKIQVLPGITSCRLMKDNNQQLIWLVY